MKSLGIVFLVAMCFCASISAQTTEFTYQGSLKDGSAAANGNYDFEFALFDAVAAGNQIGATVPKNNVAIANGIFSVKLDFGLVFPGAGRFLEIRVRLAGQPGITTLTPRQLVNSSPYSVKSLNTDTATNATQLGGVAANQYVTTTTGGANFIQNTTSPQAASNFNISGNGTAGGSLSGGIVNATTQFNIGGSRVLSSSAAQSNLFVGFGAGQSITTSFNNSFFGTVAGGANTTGEANSFFGSYAGAQNTTGISNSFFGVEAGSSNTQGSLNSLFGLHAGNLNTTGSGNSFFGNNAGFTNTTGNNNTMLGYDANVTLNNLSFATAIGSGSTVSASNTVSLGRSAGQDSVQIPGPLNVTGSSTFGGSLGANVLNATTQYNIGGGRVLFATPFIIGGGSTFVGFGAGTAGNNSDVNSFFGVSAGTSTIDGVANSFFGAGAGSANISGDGNSFFGRGSGFQTMGHFSSFFGLGAGTGNTTGEYNTLIGTVADVTVGNLTNATAIGARALVSLSNSLVLGSINGVNSATADTNVGIGTTAPNHRLTVGPTEMPVITNAIAGVYAAGATYSIVRDTTNDVEGLFGAEVSGVLYGSMTNHRVALRTNNNDRITIAATGEVAVSTLGSAGADHLCYNASLQISTCSSSLRYKTNIGQFSSGLSFVNRLRPISFDWKDGGMKDVGFGAEDVAKIDPRFVTYNTAGEVEGVKYDRLSAAFVNAFKEQQSQIEDQKTQIQTLNNLVEKQQLQLKALKQLVCLNQQSAAICKEKE